MKTLRYIFVTLAFLVSSIILFAQGYVRVHPNGQVTVNGNLVITPTTFTCGGTLVDDRDGQFYGTVKIGTQCWMKQNLNYGTRIDSTTLPANNNITEKYCYRDLESNCDVYGGLYRWDEAMMYVNTQGAKGICPDGWHIPTSGEWSILSTFLGGDAIAGGKLKEAGYNHWLSPNTGATNESGFTALPSGYYSPLYVAYINLGRWTYIWSSSQGSYGAWCRYLFTESTSFTLYDDYTWYSFPIRCLKD